MEDLSASVDYRTLFRSLPDSFLLLSPEPAAHVVDNTDSHVAVSLKSRESVVGHPIFVAYPVKDEAGGAAITQSHEHVREHLVPHTMPLIRFDLEDAASGQFEERYWQATHYPLLDEHGKLQYILQRTQDVTEQHRAELLNQQIQRELAESYDRARFIQESLPIMVWTARPDGSVDYFNQRCLQYLGCTMEEAGEWGWTEFIHPDDRPTARRRWQEAHANGTEYQTEYRLRQHDGQYRWQLVQGAPRRNEAGEVTMWVGGNTDIHEQKQLVQETLLANEAQAILSDQAYQAYQLAESQRESFYNLLMQTPALICILRGPEHRYELVNPEYQKLFPGRQLLGQTVAESLPEIAAQGILGLLNEVYETGKTFVGNEVEIKMTANSNDAPVTRYFNFTYQQFSENGIKAGITVFAFDVTDLVHARKAVAASHNATNPS